jgi:hypothetical protein
MKKIFTSLIIVGVLTGTNLLYAQNNEGKADDGSRIAITPKVSDQEIPQGAKEMLINKMKQLCTLNGLAGDSENPFFVMDANVVVLSKELTPTAPPQHALNLQVNFTIADNLTGNVYSQTSVEVKGVGQNETKAYIQAIKNVDVKKGQYKAFVDKGKTKILEFYNSQCDMIIAKGQALNKQGNAAEALKVLYSVPPVCKECYDKCMEIASGITPPPTDLPEEKQSEDQVGQQGAGTEIEIDNNIFLVYSSCKRLGQKLYINVNIENRGSKDYEFDIYWSDVRIIDNQGNESKITNMKLGNKESAYQKATILAGVPVKMECEFPDVDDVKLLEFKIKDNAFRLKNIGCSK